MNDSSPPNLPGSAAVQPTAPMIPKTSGLAIASLVLGLIPIPCFVTGIAGLICGIKARDRIRSGGGALTGDGLALAGIILSSVMIAFGTLAVLAGLLFPAFAKARERAQTISSLNNLKTIGTVQRAWSLDNEGKMPPFTWTDAITKGAVSTNLPLSCFGGEVGYAYNRALAGLKISEVNPRTVVFFETDRVGPNQMGGAEMLRSLRPRGPALCVVLADGSGQQIRLRDLDSLRWEP